MDIINLKDGVFSWPGEKPVINIPEFTVKQGEKVLIKGTSGSGKTTLLSLLTGILTLDRGLLEVRGVELKKLSPHKRDTFRGDHIGYIFQQFNLLPYLSVEDNILAPLLFSPVKKEKEKGNQHQRVKSLLKELSLDVDLKKNAKMLSIGQQQRVAVARALIGEPEIIIADEPTSSLDEETGQDFINLLFTECERHKATLLMVSHDSRLENRFPRVEILKNLNRGSYVKNNS